MSTVTASPAGKASRGQTQMILSHDCQENACVEHTGVFFCKNSMMDPLVFPSFIDLIQNTFFLLVC